MKKHEQITRNGSSATKRMTATKGRDNPRELAIRSALHRMGLRFRIHYTVLPGTRRTADIAFPKHKVAVFLDGCFWHGCPKHGTWPKSNAKWWKEKIFANRTRDENTNARLKEMGWKSVRLWEHQAIEEACEVILNSLRED